MLRLAAIRSLLLEDVAGLPREDDPALAAERLAAAARKAGAVAVLDLTAIAVLFALQERGVPFLSFGEDLGRVVFTVGVLAVAAHAGLRLGQRACLRAVARALDSLPPGDDAP